MRVGVDLAKRVIQVHAVDAAGHVLTKRAWRATSSSPGARSCRGLHRAMETSSSAHHWARKLIALGLDARISRAAGQPLPPARRSGKNDANDAAAVCEAAGAPADALRAGQEHRAAEHAVRAPPARRLQGRAHGVHQPHRGLLAEFGLVFAQSPGALQVVLADVLKTRGNEMNTWRGRCCSVSKAAVGRTGRAHRLVRRAHRRSRQGQPGGEEDGQAAGHRAQSARRRWWPGWWTSGSSATARSSGRGWA